MRASKRELLAGWQPWWMDMRVVTWPLETACVFKRSAAVRDAGVERNRRKNGVPNHIEERVISKNLVTGLTYLYKKENPQRTWLLLYQYWFSTPVPPYIHWVNQTFSATDVVVMSLVVHSRCLVSYRLLFIRPVYQRPLSPVK